MSHESALQWMISGRVQGVGFRWFVKQHARDLGLAGWARNLSDGRVEVVARGSEASLESLDRLLRQGPRLARVENVDRQDYPHEMEIANNFITK